MLRLLFLDCPFPLKNVERCEIYILHLPHWSLDLVPPCFLLHFCFNPFPWAAPSIYIDILAFPIPASLLPNTQSHHSLHHHITTPFSTSTFYFFSFNKNTHNSSPLPLCNSYGVLFVLRLSCTLQRLKTSNSHNRLFSLTRIRIRNSSLLSHSTRGNEAQNRVRRHAERKRNERKPSTPQATLSPHFRHPPPLQAVLVRGPSSWSGDDYSVID